MVVTGGPGAGKTALLEVARRQLCKHVVVLPEAASILFSGGFPRGAAPFARRASQRAIFHVQRELEALASEDHGAVVLCDRGTLDGLAYWPGDRSEFFSQLGTTMEAELARYDAILHLRTPDSHNGYDHTNPVRTESASEAAAIDERILAVWSAHPRRTIIDSSRTFVEKVERALAAIDELVPPCCRRRNRSELTAR